MPSVEEKVEEYFKKILDANKVRHYGKTEKMNPAIASALKNADSKSGGSGCNFPDIQMMLENSNAKNGMKNECLLMYLAASIQKSIKPRFGYSNKAVWSKVRKCNICLPIQTDDSGKPVIDAGKTYSPKGYIPDWEYMEKYIKATEKEIIKEVVLYKDEVIAKAKEITGEKEVAW